MSTDIKWQVPKAKPEVSEQAVVYARYSSHSQGEQSTKSYRYELFWLKNVFGLTVKMPER